MGLLAKIKKYKFSIFLILIILIAIFFRTYQAVERFEFAHDSDLYSWIVKDIVVNHHFRLIGQLTSAPGIFIGALFYYLLVPFFLLSKMDPLGGVVLTIIIGVLNVISYYFVLSKLFNKKVGLIGAYLYSTLLVTVNFDRWLVPTILTPLWSIWYLYILIQITRKNYRILPLLGILIGLIWHIHIALIPILLSLPAAFLISKKLPSLKQLILTFITFLITSLPLILFEIRHNFSQTTSLLENFLAPQAGDRGLSKLDSIIAMLSKNTSILVLDPQSTQPAFNLLLTFLLLLSPIYLIRKRVLKPAEAITLYFWMLGPILFFSVSTSLISEYYFFNINFIFLTFVSLLLYCVFKFFRYGKYILPVFLGIILLKNLYFYVTNEPYHKGYLEKKTLVTFIKEDAKLNNYPCIGISYITTPGEDVGFRYFFYLSNLHLNHPSKKIPVYNIVIPQELAYGNIKKTFGHIGLLMPEDVPPKEELVKNCSSENTNLTDSLFGYVD